MQECVHAFRKMDEEIELQPTLDELAAYPPLHLSLTEQTEGRLPLIVGGLSVALARAFTILDPEVKNPQTQHWERAFRVFDLLL